MKKVIAVVVLVLLAMTALAVYQVGSVYLANEELKEDLKDLSSLTGTRIGLVDPRGPDQIRDQVINHAAQHGIHLEPEQVHVERNGEGKDGTIFLSVAYDAPVSLFGYSWIIHFAAATPRT